MQVAQYDLVSDCIVPNKDGDQPAPLLMQSRPNYRARLISVSSSPGTPDGLVCALYKGADAEGKGAEAG